MPDAAADVAWERRQGRTPESFSLEFTAADGSLAGFLALVFHARVAWYWAALVGDGRPYLLVRELDVPPPRAPGSLEIRAEALWADMNCETPFDHWSYGLEAFGVAMDDPTEALRGERGDRVGLGLDIEWEASGPVDGGEGAYAQPGVVHGELLVGQGATPETIAFDGLGWRRHEWDGPDWFGPPWSEWAGVAPAERRSPVDVDVEADRVETLFRAPLLLEVGSARTVLDRRLCRIDGNLGWSTSRSPA